MEEGLDKCSLNIYEVHFINKKKETGCALIKARTQYEALGIIKNNLQYFSDKDIVKLNILPYKSLIEPGIILEIKNESRIY